LGSGHGPGSWRARDPGHRPGSWRARDPGHRPGSWRARDPGGREPNGGVPELARTAVRAGRARGTKAGRSSRLAGSESGAAGNLFGIGDQGPERDVRMVFAGASGVETRSLCWIGLNGAASAGFWGSTRSGVITWCHYWTGRSGAWAAEPGSVASSSWDAARWVTASCAFTLSNDLGRPGAAQD
jgi:hypothetical protein